MKPLDLQGVSVFARSSKRVQNSPRDKFVTSSRMVFVWLAADLPLKRKTAPSPRIAEMERDASLPILVTPSQCYPKKHLPTSSSPLPTPLQSRL
jgi:hypothetical protein